MAYDKAFYALLRKDRDDAKRAEALDEALPRLSEENQTYIYSVLAVLRDEAGLGDQQAKSLLVCTILFYHMKVDEQDKWREHGEFVRAQFEWAFPTQLRARLVEELV